MSAKKSNAIKQGSAMNDPIWDKPYMITYLTRRDLLKILSQDEIEKMSSARIESIVELMEAQYIDDSFWTQLMCAVDLVSEQDYEDKIDVDKLPFDQL